jgi:hypothetical protein
MPRGHQLELQCLPRPPDNLTPITQRRVLKARRLAVEQCPSERFIIHSQDATFTRKLHVNFWEKPWQVLGYMIYLTVCQTSLYTVFLKVVDITIISFQRIIMQTNGISSTT